MKHIFYFFATAATCLTLYFVNLYTNFGQFRIFVIFAFGLALAFQQFCVGVPLSKLTNRIRTAYKNKLAAKNTAANDNAPTTATPTNNTHDAAAGGNTTDTNTTKAE